MPDTFVIPGTATPFARPAEPGDEPQIALAHVTSWQDAYRGHIPQEYLDGLDASERAELWRRRLAAVDRSRGDVVVAVSGGEIAGFAAFVASRDEDADPARTGELAAMYLRPGSIGQGLGRLLMDAAIEGLAHRGYTEATLWVLDANARARRFYARAGWAGDGAVKTDNGLGFPLREVRYRRPLP
jgi:GNAT superfamily N-acetyltransferase